MEPPKPSMVWYFCEGSIDISMQTAGMKASKTENKNKIFLQEEIIDVNPFRLDCDQKYFVICSQGK
jgi:hypothetical protein